jgi:acylphosphatase
LKKRILIKGKVHEEYRLFLYSIAESLELNRFYADNIIMDDKEAVEILVEDIERDKVKEFINIINTKKPNNAIVDSIDIYDYDQPIMKRDAYYRYLTTMQLFKIAGYGLSMLDKQDLMLEKQDQTLNEIRNLRQDLSSMLDIRLKKIEEDMAKVKAKLGL